MKGCTESPEFLPALEEEVNQNHGFLDYNDFGIR